MNAIAKRPARLRTFRALIIATLVLLAVQGWFGDTVNIFLTPAGGTAKPPVTPGGLLHALQSLPSPFFPVWHTFEGLALVLLAVVVAILAFAWTRSTGVRIWAVVGLVAMLAAAAGGYEFVTSGFADGGSSAQMGGSFIGAFASYFMTLYYTK